MINLKIDPAEARLDEFAGEIVTGRTSDLGYPLNQKSQLIGFTSGLQEAGLICRWSTMREILLTGGLRI